MIQTKEEILISEAAPYLSKDFYQNDLVCCVHAINAMQTYADQEVSIKTAAFREEVERNKWISVDEKLPEEDRFVLVVFSTLYMGGPVKDVGLSRIHKGRFANAMDRTKVTHWMPLPEPPKNQTK